MGCIFCFWPANDKKKCRAHINRTWKLSPPCLACKCGHVLRVYTSGVLSFFAHGAAFVARCRFLTEPYFAVAVFGRQSRERLNKLWSGVQRSTYYKSLDRRSVDLKNEDKKAHTSRVLLADITHRCARNTQEEHHVASHGIGFILFRLRRVER